MMTDAAVALSSDSRRTLLLAAASLGVAILCGVVGLWLGSIGVELADRLVVTAGLGVVAFVTSVAGVLVWRRRAGPIIGWVGGTAFGAAIATTFQVAGRVTGSPALLDGGPSLLALSPFEIAAWTAVGVALLNVAFGPPLEAPPNPSDLVLDMEDVDSSEVTIHGVISWVLAGVSYLVAHWLVVDVTPTVGSAPLETPALDVVLVTLLLIGFTHAQARLAWLLAGDRPFRPGVYAVRLGTCATWVLVAIASMRGILGGRELPPEILWRLGSFSESGWAGTVLNHVLQGLVVVGVLILAWPPLSYLAARIPRHADGIRYAEEREARDQWRQWRVHHRVIGIAGASVAGLGERFGASNAAKGAAGERAIGGMLNAAVRRHDNLWVFHDLHVPGWERANIDHSLAAGSKLVLVDSKAWPSGTYTVDDAGYLCIDGHRYVAASALDSMHAIFDAICRYLPPDVCVSSIAVIRPPDGRPVDVTAVGDFGGVRLVAVDHLPRILDRLAETGGEPDDQLLRRMVDLTLGTSTSGQVA